MRLVLRGVALGLLYASVWGPLFVAPWFCSHNLQVTDADADRMMLFVLRLAVASGLLYSPVCCSVVMFSA
jgi:hypothetical protein